ncbi:MAG: type II secretion system protein [Nitrospirota bacterium]
MRNTKAFTLIEVLLIITLIGMLAVAAFTSFFDTSATFTFFSEYKPIILDMRKARSYAINNKDSDLYDRYGIAIYPDEMILFGDAGEPYVYDPPADHDVDTLNLAPYEMKFLSGVGGQILPIFLYYEYGSGELSAYASTVGDLILIDKKDTKRIDLEFTDNLELSKYIYIFQVSGIAEESATAL